MENANNVIIKLKTHLAVANKNDLMCVRFEKCPAKSTFGVFKCAKW